MLVNPVTNDLEFTANLPCVPIVHVADIADQSLSDKWNGDHRPCPDDSNQSPDRTSGCESNTARDYECTEYESRRTEQMRCRKKNGKRCDKCQQRSNQELATRLRLTITMLGLIRIHFGRADSQQAPRGQA